MFVRLKTDWIEKQEDGNTETAEPAPQTFTKKQEGISEGDVIVRKSFFFLNLKSRELNRSKFLSMRRLLMGADSIELTIEIEARKQSWFISRVSDVAICGYSDKLAPSKSLKKYLDP